jgi:hypothetical protein
MGRAVESAVRRRRPMELRRRHARKGTAHRTGLERVVRLDLRSLDLVGRQRRVGSSARQGFDTAVALHMGRVLSPPRPVKKGPPAKYAGYFVMKGLQGAPPARIMSVAKTVTAADPNAKAGARVAFKELIKKTGVLNAVAYLPPGSQSYDAPGPPPTGNSAAGRERSGPWFRRNGPVILVGV